MEASMRIEINEKGTRELFREVVNVLMQHKKLIRDPEAALNDNFTSFRKIGIAAAVAFVIDMLCGFLLGWSRPVFICTAILWVCAAMLLAYLNKMNKAVSDYLANDRPSVVTLDERGAALSRDGSLVMRFPWDEIAFVRAFNESTCIVPKEELGVVIIVNNAHLDEVKEFFKNNEVGVRTVL